MESKLFHREFKMNSLASIGGLNSQINQSITTIFVDGKEYPWDPVEMLFFLEDSIKNYIKKTKKKNGFLNKDE